ncbi:hypothetical protein MEQU1_002283 [Malassezia equina]|uniref:37S ribosomal protein S18, mitochondrial n=1 Tax=Malassezia equina TaxID=1381935 RepID=A0AAF0IZ38_9BASI|nr:hypothetical protein MEQU1_002283 [Malassezia equina]
MMLRRLVRERPMALWPRAIAPLMRPAMPMRMYSETPAPPADEPAASALKASSDAETMVSLDSAVEFTPLPGMNAGERTESVPPTSREPPSPRGRTAPHRMHVQASRNNTIITFTMPTGEPLARASGGSVGFRKAARSGYEAGYRAAVRVFQQIGANKKRWNVNGIEVLWNGFGQGREAVFRAFQASEGEMVRNLVKVMTDKTPIKIGGVRPKKRRSTYPMTHRSVIN